jgi:hydroxypyruvate isomerase
VNNLREAAVQAAKVGVDLLIEPINTRDIPRFFLNRQDHAHEIIREVGAANVKVQMDLYHCQVVEGDLAMKLRKYLPTGQVGHLQIAGAPGRNEPDVGEINYPYLLALLDELRLHRLGGLRIQTAARRPNRRHAGRTGLVEKFSRTRLSAFESRFSARSETSD